MSKSLLIRVTVAALMLGSLGLFVISGDEKDVIVRDDCDPTTFNAAVGPGTCVGSGKTTFADFIAELIKHQIAVAWRFNPREFDVPAGKMLMLENRGGETHTFTKVAEFGGGFVPPLNTLSGNPIPAPECLAPPSPTNIFVEAGETDEGPTAGTTVLPTGQETKFQCCVHPWMRTKIRVP